MQNVLAHLALESEAATTLIIRLADAVDPQEHAFKRLAVAVGKYWVTKRGPVFAGEALACLGGNGYVEDSGMPRLYREAPLPSVWEGSGNVNALDVLRAMAKEPESVEALALQASLLVRQAPAYVADAFCVSRLTGDWGITFGTLPRGLDLRAIVERAAPATS